MKTPVEVAERALVDVIHERNRQRELGRGGSHDYPRWRVILGEEIGEADRVANDAWATGSADVQEMLLEDLRIELVQAAAVMLAMIEDLDLRGVSFVNDESARQEVAV